MREIARMPQYIVQYFIEKDFLFEYGVLTFDCEGINNLVYIIYGSSCGIEVLVYSLGENIWTCLPRWPVLESDRFFPHLCLSLNLGIQFV